jgi:hypothetical protein
MSAIGNININAVTAVSARQPALPSSGLAAAAVGTIGHRVLAWIGDSAGARQSGADAWAAQAGASDFTPDAAELARGGDIYGLRELAGHIATETAAGPVDQGAIHRALEDLTRATVVQLAGLSGKDGEEQTAGLADALVIAGFDGPQTATAVIGRLDAATASLSMPTVRDAGTS